MINNANKAENSRNANAGGTGMEKFKKKKPLCTSQTHSLSFVKLLYYMSDVTRKSNIFQTFLFVRARHTYGFVVCRARKVRISVLLEFSSNVSCSFRTQLGTAFNARVRFGRKKKDEKKEEEEKGNPFFFYSIILLYPARFYGRR